MSRRTLVKLDDAIIEVKQNEEGELEAVKLSSDEVFETSLLDEGVSKFLENDVNKLANEAYKELQDSFKRTLKENVLKIVGFDNHWDHKWEIDHCNGRDSALTQYLANKVKNMFTEEFDKLLQPEIAKMVAPMKKELTKEFKNDFVRYVRASMKAEAETAAREFLHELFTQEVQKFQKEAIETVENTFLGRKASIIKEDV